MGGTLGIGGFIIRVLLLTALVFEAAEALGGGQLLEPGPFPGEPAPLDPVFDDPAPAGPLPEPPPAPVSVTGAGEVGRTRGHGTVLPTGEAAYSVPLDVPPGTHGLTPVVSLEYRHYGGAGWAGMGWSPGGVSIIARCPRTLAQDGVAGSVTRSMTDRFCLDGQRLVVSNGRDYGSAGAEYRTEQETYARIRSYGTAGAGPQHFVVERADGRIAEYGMTADSRVDAAGRYYTPRAWALNRLRDRAGNVIDYRYTEDSVRDSFRLSGISYNGNPSAGVAHAHDIVFAYEPRPEGDVDQGFVAGEAVRRQTRLDRVDVLHQGIVVRRYELDYEAAPSSAGRSRLAAIRECGRDGATCLQPTRLQWQDGTPGLGAEQAYTWALGSTAWAEEGKSWFVGDVNGDGMDDVVWSGGSTATLRYRLGQRPGSYGAEVDTGVPAPNGAGVPLDYDGDGATDVLMVSAARRWQVVRGGATGLGATVDTGIPAQAIDYRGADLDGNGLSDLAWSEIVGFGGNGLVVRVRYNQPGTGFSQVPVTLYEQGYHAGYEWPEGGNFLGRADRPIDLDGDGREDLLMNEEYSIARVSADERMSEHFDSSFNGGVPADFNGDGCTDFAYPHFQGQWRVRFSGCLVSGPTGVEIAGPRYDGLKQPIVALDWNGDGRDDLLYADTTSNWRVVRSAGDSLFSMLDSGVAHGSPTTAAVADVDGDGLDDLVTRAGTRLAVRAHPGVAPDLLLSVRDGFGITTAFHYEPLTQTGVHVRSHSAAYPQQDLQDGRQVVTVQWQTDGSGRGTLAETAYRYRGLRRDLHGRGDLGFAARTSIPAAADARVVEHQYRQGFPFSGLVAREVVTRKDGVLLRDTVDQWKALASGSGAAARQRPYLASSTEKWFEPGGLSGSAPYRTVQASVAAIDSTSGRVTDGTVVVTEGAGGSTPGVQHVGRWRVPSLMNDTANWCLGRPQSLLYTASHGLQGGAERATEQSVTWDATTCRVVGITRQPGDPSLQVQGALEYDRFGNIARTTTTGAGMAPRVSDFDWGPEGRGLVRALHPHAMAWSARYDGASGALRSWTDANGLVTHLEYDGLDRLVAEVHPDGRRTEWVSQPCGGDCDPRAVQRVVLRERDAAGVVAVERRADVDAYERVARLGTRRPGGGWSEQVTEFDVQGRVSRLHQPSWESGASSGFWQYAYDPEGRVVEASLLGGDGALARSVRVEHEGLQVTMTDSQGRQTVRRFTAWGDVASVDQPGGAALRFDHDGFGRLLRIQDESGRILSELTYDARGRKTSHVDADLGPWSFTWNALDELLMQRDAKGQVTRFEYDLLGRMVRRTEAEGVTAWAWGTSRDSRNVGQLVSVAGPGYTERYAYDAASRLATRTIQSDASYQYAYGWDAAGRLGSLTYPASTSGFRLQLGYEYESGAVVRIRDQSAQGRILWQLGATDAAGRVLDESLGAVVRTVAGYDPSTGEMEYQQAISMAGNPLQDLEYRWDELGNLLERQDLLAGFVERFTYDAGDRLTGVHRNGMPDLAWRYDAAGNVTWRSDVCAGAADCFAYDPVHRHAVAAAGAYRYAYDANGNMSSRNGAAIGWYSYNLPKSIASGSNRSSLWYGPARNRWKQVSVEDGATETTVYVGGLMDKVTRGGKTSWRHYVQAPTGTAAVHVRQSDGSAPQTYFLTHDHLGGTRGIVDGTSGALLASEAFDAFGRRRSSNGLGAPSAAEWSVIRGVTRDGFTGHEHLDSVGLVHMNGRVYDPAIGRFLSPDPIVQSPFDREDLNRYAYGWNNPLNVVDPTGLTEVTCLHGPGGRCQGVTVTGLRSFPAISTDWVAWRSGGSGQAVSAAQRDPCGQDGSSEACARSVSARGTMASPSETSADGGLGNSLAIAGRAALNLVPGWYYSGVAADWMVRGEYVNATLFYGAAVADVFMVGRAGALAHSLRSLPEPVASVATGSFSPVRPGPLSRHVASTFRSATYQSRVLEEPLDVYRVIGEHGRPSGQFWTPVKPKGSLQSVIDLAIDQNWRNPATTVIHARLPAGTLIYEGPAAAQRGLVGGAPQIYIPVVDPRWMK